MFDQLRYMEHFENDGDKNRLVIALESDTPIIDFQVDMIRNNRIPGVLGLDMRRVDSRPLLYYDVTGKWMLKDLLDHKEFSGVEFLALLEKFIQALTGAEAYLLDLTQFALDEEHIFLEGDMEPRLLYLPVKNTQNVHERFKNLLLQLIVYRARVADQDSGPVLSGILNYMKRDSFNLYEFQKALRTMSNPEGHSSSQETVKSEIVPRRPDSVSLVDLIPKENRTPGTAHQKITDASCIQSTREHPTKTKLKTSAMVAIIGFQIILGAGVIGGFGPVYAMAGDAVTAYAAMGLMVLCLDGLVLKSLLKAENWITVQGPGKKEKKPGALPRKASNGSLPVNQQPKEPTETPISFNRRAIGKILPAEQESQAFYTEMLTDGPAAGLDNTVLLSCQQAVPYLVRKGPVHEIIRLKRPKLVLGRQADMSDYVIDDPAIGRMHAELSWVGNACQIRDLNAKNGTFVNGIRLAGPQGVNIFIGDDIKLGPLEYTLAQD